MNRLLIATAIFFASFAGTAFAVIFLLRRMFVEAFVSYGTGWIGWGIAAVIGGQELIERRRKYRQIFKKSVKWIFRRRI